MLVGIHPDQKYGKLSVFSKRYVEILSKNNIPYEILQVGEDNFWRRVSDCDLFIFRWLQHDYFRQIALSILPLIEGQLKVKCFPSQLSSWLYDDKLRESCLFEAHNLPFIETALFFDKIEAFDYISKVEFPIVFKLKSGAGAQTVKLIGDQKTAKYFVNLMFGKGVSYKNGLKGSKTALIKERGVFSYARKQLGALRIRINDGKKYFDADWEIHKNYILFQKFLPGNSYDTRIVVIGDRAFGFIRYNRQNDFRASGSKMNNYSMDMIDMRFVEKAFDISTKLNFECMAYDFLYDQERQPKVCEISYAFGSSYGSDVNKCPGYWDKKLIWHKASIDPELFLLSDLLGNDKLKS
jgi:glutathione synthase/RimK-type ligase-like ATP-grasp enzyme